VFIQKNYNSFEEWLTTKFIEDDAYPKSGNLTLEFEIGKNGKPDNIVVINENNKELSEKLRKLIKKSPKWKWENTKDQTAKYLLQIQI